MIFTVHGDALLITIVGTAKTDKVSVSSNIIQYYLTQTKHGDLDFDRA